MTKIVKKKHADSEKYDGLTFLQSTYIYIVDTIYIRLYLEFYIYFSLPYVLHCTQQYMGNEGKNIN